MRATLVATILLLCSLALQARSAEVRVYALRHQLAESLVPVVQQSLEAGESVQAFNNQLVVNASSASHEQVAALLATLDQPMRSLLITVRNLRDSQGASQQASISGGIRQGDVYVGTGKNVQREQRSNNSGLTIRDDGLSVHTEREERQQGMQQEQQVRAIEGEPAWISTGHTIAYRTSDQRGNPATDFRDANQGFYVTARITGNLVQLQISATNDKLPEDPRLQRRGIIETARLQTTANGSVGEWIPLGGIMQQQSGEQTGYTSRGEIRSLQVGDIAVRVLPLD